MTIQNKNKPHVNVGVIGHAPVTGSVFAVTIRDLMMQSKPGDVILICPEGTSAEMLRKIIKEHILIDSPVTISTPAPAETVPIDAEVRHVLENSLKSAVPVPAYAGTPYPPPKQRVPLKFHMSQGHRAGIHLIRPHQKRIR